MRRALLVILVLAGCGGGDMLRAHTKAAEAMEAVASEAREAVLAWRKAELERARDTAKARGEDPVSAVDTAAANFQPKVDALNVFIAAKQAYVMAVLAAARDEGWSGVMPVLAKALEAYRHLRVAMGDGARLLPAVPPVVERLLPVERSTP